MYVMQEFFSTHYVFNFLTVHHQRQRSVNYHYNIFIQGNLDFKLIIIVTIYLYTIIYYNIQCHNDYNIIRIEKSIIVEIYIYRVIHFTFSLILIVSDNR